MITDETKETAAPVQDQEVFYRLGRMLPAHVLSEDPGERMIQRLLVAFGLLSSAIIVPLIAGLFLVDPAIRLPRVIAMSVALILAANPLWLRMASPRKISWMTVLLLHAAVLPAIAMNLGPRGPMILCITFLPAICAVLLGILHGWFDMGIVVLFFIALEYLGGIFELPSIVPPEVWPYARILTLVISVGLMLLVISAHSELSSRRAQDVARARDAALKASRAKSRFLSFMSHELRTPMVGVIGATELLKQSGLSPEQIELVDVLHTSSKVQLELIGNVLDLANIETGRIELEYRPVSPSQILADVESLFRVVCQRKGLALEIDIDPKIPSLFLGDASRIRQVLSNLVGNAYKFTERGSITISARASGESENPRLRFDVVDTGIGFEPTLSEQIFDAFRQIDESTTRRFSGSGLGLAICKHLVGAMGGMIHAESRPGRGSTFTFEIPAPRADLPEADRETSIDEPPVPPLAILLVDDDRTNRLILSSMLRSLGHTTMEAANGLEALEIAASQPIDLIILDMFMPELDGPACARELRRLPGPASSVPIIGLTADAIVDHHTGYMTHGIDSIFTKPIELEELKRAIAAAVAELKDP